MTVPQEVKLARHAGDLDDDGHDTTGGVSDHGLLTGLLDDDHTQYLETTKGGGDVVQAHGNAGAAETIDPASGNVHKLTLDANCTITLTGPASGPMSSLEVYLTQDATGSRTVTWPGTVVWPGGVTPTLSTPGGSIDRIHLETSDGGTTWFGNPIGGTAPAGAAGGDLSGTYPNPSVVDDSHSHTASTLPATSAGHVHLVGETAVGDGAQTVFYLAQEAEPGTAAGYSAGVRVGITQDATELDKVTFGAAPGAGAEVVFDYVPSLT